MTTQIISTVIGVIIGEFLFVSGKHIINFTVNFYKQYKKFRKFDEL